MKKGKLILIEGNDKQLKSRQATLLMNKLRANKIGCGKLDLSGSEFTCFGEKGEDYTDFRVACLHHAAERLSLFQKVKDIIYDGRHVLLDGYIESTMAGLGRHARSSAEKKSIHDYASKLEFKTHSLPDPDLRVFISFYPRNSEREDIQKSFATVFRRENWETVRVLDEDNPYEKLADDLYDISLKVINS